MTRKTRLLLFSLFVFLYLIIAPIMIFYSLGYRIDFENKKLVSTGGLYLKIWPQGVNILIDKKINKKLGLFSNQMLIQGLFSKEHTILVEKEGYLPWQKTLGIKRKEVARVENITLIKEKIVFEKIAETIGDYYLSPNGRRTLLAINQSLKDAVKFSVFDNINRQEINSHVVPLPKSLSDSLFKISWSVDSKKILISFPKSNFVFDNNTETFSQIATEEGKILDVSFNPQNSDEIFFIKNNALYSINQETIPIINNLLVYQIYDNKIFWLDESGFVHKSDITGKEINVLNETPIIIKKENPYQIFVQPNLTFLKEKDDLFLLNLRTKVFERFYSPINDSKVSPDGFKIVYFNDNEIFYSSLTLPSEKTFLYRFSEKINDCFWLNSNYLIFDINGQIKISEIDTRDKINIVELPQQILLTDNTFSELKNPKIFWDGTNKKLYILNQYILFVSEQIINKSNN